MNYAVITQTEENYPDWPVGLTRYYIYDDNLTCSEAETAFQAMSPAQRMAKTVLNEPALNSDEVKQLRGCSAQGDTPWQLDTDDGSDGYIPDPSGGGNTGGGTVSDPGSESNVTYYTSASGDDGGTK